jgi:dimethylamine/trimethylamine dehydrogenase
MSQQSRYEVLFESVRIGPVTAPNRFYQVPHASGMTNALPRTRAAFRGRRRRAAGALSVPGPARSTRPRTIPRFRLPRCGMTTTSARMRS